MSITADTTDPAGAPSPIEQRGRERAARYTATWTNPRAFLLVLLISLLVIFRLLRPIFWDQNLVLFPLIRDISLYIVVALAQMVTLSLGHMNLAVGRMAAFGAMIMGLSFDKAHLPLPVGLLLGLVGGAAVGALAGVIIVRTGVSSFVVTLALDFALLGLIPVVYSATTQAAAYTERPAGMDSFRNGSLADLCIGSVCGPKLVPYLSLFTFAALIAVWFLYRRTTWGREVLLTGANADAAELSGIPTSARIVGVHALSGTLAALAGFMAAATTGSFKAAIGGEFMLPSFVGAILGGTALAGGIVSVWGTVLGSSVMLVIRKGLEVMGIGLESLNIWLGVILLVAVSFERVRDVFSALARRARWRAETGAADQGPDRTVTP